MRIADVYPLVRMARSVRSFSYSIPENEQMVKRGTWVAISFRGRRCIGIVSSVSTTEQPPSFRLLPLSSVLSHPSLSTESLRTFEEAAQMLLQSPSSLLHALLPHHFPKRPSLHTRPQTTPAPPLTLLPHDVEPLVKAWKQLVCHPHPQPLWMIGLRSAAWYGLITKTLQSPSLMSDPKRETILVLVPTQDEVERAKRALSSFSPICLSGEESALERARLFLEMGKKAPKVVIGTRLSVLWPMPWRTIFVTQASHDAYRQRDRNPRYDVRTLLCTPSLRAIPQIWSDALPPLAVLAQDTTMTFATIQPLPAPIVVDRTQEEQLGKDLVGPRLQHHLREAQEAGGNMLIFHTSVQEKIAACKRCQSTFLCGVCGSRSLLKTHQLWCATCQTTARPDRCPSCRQPLQLGKHITLSDLATELRAQVPEGRIELLTTDLLPTSQPTITIASPRILEEVRPWKQTTFHTILVLNADEGIGSDRYDAFEAAWQRLARLQHLALEHNATLVVQSRHPTLWQACIDHPIERLKEEFDLRVSYRQPPAVHLWRIWVRSEADRPLLTRALETLQNAHPEVLIHLRAELKPVGYELLIPMSSRAAVTTLLQNLSDRVLIEVVC